LLAELLRGGELFDRIIRRTYYSEKEAREVVFTLLSTIKVRDDDSMIGDRQILDLIWSSCL
jgi:hypothetical protein